MSEVVFDAGSLVYGRGEVGACSAPAARVLALRDICERARQIAAPSFEAAGGGGLRLRVMGWWLRRSVELLPLFLTLSVSLELLGYVGMQPQYVYVVRWRRNRLGRWWRLFGLLLAKVCGVRW